MCFHCAEEATLGVPTTDVTPHAQSPIQVRHSHTIANGVAGRFSIFRTKYLGLRCKRNGAVGSTQYYTAPPPMLFRFFGDIDSLLFGQTISGRLNDKSKSSEWEGDVRSDVICRCCPKVQTNRNRYQSLRGRNLQCGGIHSHRQHSARDMTLYWRINDQTLLATEVQYGIIKLSKT